MVPHLPRPWGRGPRARWSSWSSTRRCARPGYGRRAWPSAPGSCPALIQYGTQGPAGPVPAAHAARRVPVVPAVQRAGGRLGPGRADHPGGAGRRRLAADRAEDLDLAGQGRRRGRSASPAPTRPAPRHDGITYFLVDMSAPGVEVRPLREITGDSFFNEVFLDDVFVPDDCVVGEVNGGWRVARTTLANERVSLSRSWTFGSGVRRAARQVRGGGRVRPAARPGRHAGRARATRSTCWAPG